jgi:drug/metabolite transporter (DMT)-like permease
MKNRTILFATGFVLLWNSGFIGAEYGLPYTGPFTLIFWRYLALTVMVFLFLLAGNRFQRVSWSVVFPNMLVGVLAHGVWLGGVLLSLERDVPAGLVALVVSLQPLATGAFSGMVVNEPTPWHRWAGLIIGFIGVAIALVSRIDFGDAQSVFGYLVPLLSVIGITIATLIQRKIDVQKSNKHLSIDMTIFYQSLATTVVFAFPAVFYGQLQTDWQPEFINAMLWLIVGVSLGAYSLMWRLVEILDATRVASLFYLGPPVTMLMAWAAFGDLPQTMDILGMVVVLIGIIITQKTNVPSKQKNNSPSG